MAVDFTLVVDPVGAQLAATRECEAAVFLETYGNTAEQFADEYGHYESASVYIGVLDAGGEAVGAARLILPLHRTVKSLADVERAPWSVDGLRAARAAGIDPDLTWDVATLAVRRGAGRGGLISAALYHGLIRTLRANRARWIVMIMDMRARRLLDMAGLRTQVLPGTAPGPYLGSTASVPLWAELTTMMDNQRRTHPEAHRLIDLGIGLDGVATPFDFDIRRPELHPVARPALRRG